jgi:molecular chaperone DnaK
VNVSAKDLATSKEQKITITGSSGLSKDEVDRMTKDAELHAEEDKKRREAIEARNRADQMVYQAEKMVADAGDKLTEAEKTPVTEAVADLRKVMEGDDVAAINSAIERLTQAQHKAAESLYRQQASAPEGGAAGGQEPASGAAAQDGEVIDAEVVDEK